MQAITTLLEEMDDYIRHSAFEAANYFKRRDMKFSPFGDDSYIEFDNDFCVSIYKDLITELVTNNKSAMFKYGMFVLVVAVKVDSNVMFGLKLGVCFADVEAK